jgi:hypothetical protein
MRFTSGIDDWKFSGMEMRLPKKRGEGKIIVCKFSHLREKIAIFPL